MPTVNGVEIVSVTDTGATIEAAKSVSSLLTGGAGRVLEGACRDVSPGKAEILFNLPAAAFSEDALCPLDWISRFPSRPLTRNEPSSRSKA